VKINLIPFVNIGNKQEKRNPGFLKNAIYRSTKISNNKNI
jgi:hypothetical protein